MKIDVVTRIRSGSVQHAASYDPHTGEIVLYCNALKMATYYARIVDPTKPTEENVTCKRCLKNKSSFL